ncbi:hypothetical protein SLEP1_g15812 [Rubroshorea leprosula]|uniref:Uncharacterized protein n=1 Tax=Rubroshorea leprosula TaxID=152421 RepID=A0AAV5IUL7_9ROSI|nr:hypothetical protein SLEP1_g15812 [Rubroshorea leprosula]
MQGEDYPNLWKVTPETADHLDIHFRLICFSGIFLSQFGTAYPCDPRSFLSWHSRAWGRRTSSGGLSLELMLGGSCRRDWGMFDILIVGEHGGKRIVLCSMFLEFCIRGLQWVGVHNLDILV